MRQIAWVDTIADDFAIFDNIDQVPLFDFPTRMDCVMFAICTRGYVEIGINLERHTLRSQQLGVMRPDQILQLFHISDDFEGKFILMSRAFLEDARIDFKNALTMFLYFKENPFTDLTQNEADILMEYHAILKRKVRLENLEYRKVITQHILHALFYEVNMFFSSHKSEPLQKQTRKEELFEQFMKTVAMYYKKERSVAFYADKLCLTPKYLSTTVKEVSGRLAGEWINQCVILEAKTLLKSTGKNIQQIAEELNFANQSFFGKYFKQHTGISPREYKKQ